MLKIRTLVIGLTSIIDEPVFLANKLKEKYGITTEFITEGLDKRIADPRLSANVSQISRGFLKSIIFLLMKNKVYKPNVIEQYLASSNSLKDIIYTFIFNLLGTKRIVHCIGGEILYWKSHSRIRKFSIRYSLKTANAYVCKEPYMMDNIIKYNIADINKYHFSENAIDCNFYSKSYKNIKSDKSKVVLFYNSFKKWRNIDILIQSANEITSRYKDVTFLIVGARNPYEYNYAMSFVTNHDQIKILFQSNDKELFYSFADIFVLPADYIFLNVSLLEAMSIGLPCIISNVQDVDKIITNGVNGITCNNKDVIALTEAIINLLDNEGERIRLGNNAKEVIINRFNINDRAQRHYNVYKQILNIN